MAPIIRAKDWSCPKNSTTAAGLGKVPAGRHRFLANPSSESTSALTLKLSRFSRNLGTVSYRRGFDGLLGTFGMEGNIPKYPVPAIAVTIAGCLGSQTIAGNVILGRSHTLPFYVPMAT